MRAKVGDWLVIKGTTVERSDQRGVITEVRSADGSPPYTVRWLTSGHVATDFSRNGRGRRHGGGTGSGGQAGAVVTSGELL